MPYAKCPDCGNIFHLLIQKNIDEWNKKFPASENGHRYIQCLACWKKLNELDINKQKSERGEREQYK